MHAHPSPVRVAGSRRPSKDNQSFRDLQGRLKIVKSNRFAPNRRKGGEKKPRRETTTTDLDGDRTLRLGYPQEDHPVGQARIGDATPFKLGLQVAFRSRLPLRFRRLHDMTPVNNR